MILFDLDNLEYLSGSKYSDTFKSEWNGLKEHFIKFEFLQEYNTPNDVALNHFFNGDFELSRLEIEKQIGGQKGLYESAKAKGIKLSRIRMVKKPISEYLRYEFLSYLESQKYGESISIIEEQDFDKLDRKITMDYVLFDSTTLLVLDYDENQIFKGAYCSKNVSINKQMIKFSNLLLDKSYDLNDFIQRNRRIFIF